jgi:hypothetical protein
VLPARTGPSAAKAKRTDLEAGESRMEGVGSPAQSQLTKKTRQGRSKERITGGKKNHGLSEKNDSVERTRVTPPNRDRDRSPEAARKTEP